MIDEIITVCIIFIGLFCVFYIFCYIKKINNINPSKTVFYLGAWNFLKEIKKKEKNFLKKGGQFLIHTPYPKLIR